MRDQRVLLKRGALTLDFGVSYSYSERTFSTIERVEQRSVITTAALRYGLLNDFQVSVRVPRVWQRSTTFTDATISGTTTPSVASDDYTGDVSVSLLGVALHEAVGRPNIIWSVDGVLPAG